MNYEDMVPDVQTDVMGCPTMMVERALRDAAIELCEKGYIYQVEQGPETIEAGVEEFYLELPPRTRLVSMLSLKVGERELSPITRADLDASGGAWREPGSTYGYTIGPTGTVRLVRAPVESLAGDVWARFVVAPTLRSTSLPDAVAQEWYDALVSGAKHRLMLTPNASWTSPELANIHRQRFQSGVSQARLLFAQDSVNAQRVVVPQAFI